MTDETKKSVGVESAEVVALGDESPPIGELPPEKTGSPSVVLLVLLIIPLLGILGALLMVLSNRSPDEQMGRTGSLINFPAPNFELASLDGQTFYTPESMRGDIVFINFWQTTCEPCVRELPAFEDFAREQASNGVRVLAVNFEENSQQVRDFLDDLGVTGLEVALDPEGIARRSYGVVAIPMTYIVAPDGTVRFLHLGELKIAEMEEYAELVTLTQGG